MSEHRRRRSTTGIHRIATALTTPTTGDELGEAVHQVIDELVRVEFSGLFLVDPTTGRLRLMASRGFTDEQRSEVERSAPGRSPGWVVAHGQRLYVPDTTLDPERALPGEAYRHVRSLIYFPVMRAEVCIGVLGVGARAADAFDAETIELLAVACSLAGAVGQNILVQERLRAREVQAAQRRLDALLDAAADAIVCCDVEGRITHWNRGAESLLGRTAEEAVGQPVTIIMPERFRALHQGGLDQHRASGTVRLMGQPLELDALHADGREIPIELVLNRVDEQGAALFVGVLRDLRSRRQLEHEARLSAALHSAVLSSIGDAVVACDTATRITVLNPVGEALTGWSTAEARGRPIAEVFRVISAETREPAEVPIAEVLATGRSLELAANTLLVRRDGVEIPIADSAAPVVQGGVIQGVVLTFRDVSRERDRSRARREEGERFAALLSTTAAVIYSVRLPAFDVEFVSESATLLLGFSVEEMLEPGFWARAVHPDDLPRIMAELGALYTNGWHIHEYRHRHKDGHYVWLRDQMRLVFDEAGAPTRAIGASFDISARKLDETRGAARLAFKQIISRISRAFLGSDRSPDDALRTALEELGERACARRVAVLQLRDGRYDCTHEWCADGVASARVGRQRHPIEEVEPWAMASDGARHVSPIASDGVQRGFLVLDAPDLAPLDPEEADGLLLLVADALAAGFKRVEVEAVSRDLHQQLTRKTENQRAAIDLSMEMARAESRERLLATVSRHLDGLVDVGCGSLGHRDAATGQFRLRALGRSPKRASSPPGATDAFSFLVCGGVDLVVPEEALAGTALARALDTGAAVSTRDHAVEAFTEWSQLRERRGYKQFLSCPLVGPSGPFGSLNIALAHDEPPSPDELGTFTQIAALLAAHLSIHWAREALGALNAQLERRVQARTSELQASEERVERLFQFAPQAMMMFDAAGLVTRSNRGAQALFGYDEQEFLGVSVEALVPPEMRVRHRGLVQAFLTGTVAGPTTAGRTVQGVRRDGSRFTAEITLVSIHTSQEQQVLVGITDVSAARAAQEDLKRSLEEKETLLKEIHHRVKNNLQIISSLLMLQSEHMPSDKTRAMLEESVYRVRSMALIHQQLYGVDSLARIDLGEYTRTLTETLRSTLAPASRIELRLAPAEVTIEVAVPLGLILNELITNAFKYGMRPKGEPRASDADCDVLVEVGSEGDTVRIAVTDSGPGLPLEVNPARASTLGLQLVRSLTRQLRGKLTVEREGGTRFALVCPRALGD